jgi:hypothetical protein
MGAGEIYTFTGGRLVENQFLGGWNSRDMY